MFLTAEDERLAILHVVLLHPRPDTTDDDIAGLWRSLDGLATTIAGIERVDYGPNVSPEGLGQGYPIGFVVRFGDAAARDAYLPHPAHLGVVPQVQAVAERVLVFDLETTA